MPTIISSSNFFPKFQTHISTCQPATIQTFHTYFKLSVPESDIIIIFRKSIPITILSVLVGGTTIHQLRNQAIILALFLFLTVMQPITNPIDPISQTNLNFLIQLHRFVSGIICQATSLVFLSLSTYLVHGKFIENELLNMLITLHYTHYIIQRYNSYLSSPG